MRVAFLTVLLIVLAAAGAAILYAGLHPPPPKTHTVDRPVSTDSLPTH